jgi:asparagine synthetase B (glutamine-hydrolysing)
MRGLVLPRLARLTDAAFAAACSAAGLRQSDRVVVALSGGVDSTALCWLAGRARFREVAAVSCSWPRALFSPFHTLLFATPCNGCAVRAVRAAFGQDCAEVGGRAV